ncbi:MAG: outer membrane beta-barrel protein [Polymorphobacter sp.]
MRTFCCNTLLAATSLAAVIAATPTLAAPSTAGDDPGFANTGLTTVPAVTGRGWRLEAGVRSIYDTNILRAGDGIAIRPGSEKEDFRISPTVSAAIGVPVGRQQVFFGATLGRDYYIENTQLDRNRYALGGGINLRAGTRCTATVAADFNSQQVLVSEVAELVPNLQERFTYGASATCESAVGLGFGGSIRRSEIRNDSFSRNQFDLNSTSYSPNISYALGGIGRFSLSGTFNQVDYPERSVTVPGGMMVRDGVDILSGRFGYQRELGPRLSLTLGVSYLESQPKPVTVIDIVGVTVPPAPPGFILGPIKREKFTGLGYDGSISYTPSPRLGVTLSAARNVSASANVGAQYQVTTDFGADIDYKLGRAISVGTGVTYNKRSYFNSFATIDERARRIRDEISRVYGSISYAPVKLYSLSLEVAYQDRNSNPVEFSFNSFSAVLSLRMRLGRES